MSFPLIVSRTLICKSPSKLFIKKQSVPPNQQVVLSCRIMKMWHWSPMLKQSQKSEPNHAVSRKDKCKSLIWNGKYLTSNLHQLYVLYAHQTEKKGELLSPKCSFKIPAGSTWLVILCDRRAPMDLVFTFCETPRKQESAGSGYAASRGLRAHSVLWNWTRCIRSRTVGWWGSFFPKLSSPQFLCDNNRVYQDSSHLVSPIISITQQRAVEWREVKHKK